MYKVKNLKSGNFTKDACSRKVLVFGSKEDADKFAASLNVFAVVDRKRDRFVVVAI